MAALPPRRPWYSPMALARRLMFYYLFLCVALFSLQNYLLFPHWLTGAVLSADEAEKEARVVGLVPWSPMNFGLQGYVPADFPPHSPRGTIVVFHGNAGWCRDRTYYVEAFQRRGFQTFLDEYPGYGGRSGTPSEATIVPQARAVIRWLDKTGHGPIYIWGESVGAGIAASVCADPTLPVHGLTLLTPWDSLTSVAMGHYPFVPISLLLSDHYDSVANLAQFHHPICVIGSAKDVVIPISHALNLYAGLPEPKKLIVQPGCGHNDWPSQPYMPWWDDALNFMAPAK